MFSQKRPLVTVIISTRNRPTDIGNSVERLLSNKYNRFELIVVDQSDKNDTRDALTKFKRNSRFRYIKSNNKGVAIGRNQAIGEAHGEIIAITDDDCIVANDWLENIVLAFSKHSRIGVIFGNVIPASFDPTKGFIPGYVRDTAYLATTINDKHRVEGLSACMGIRKDLWQKLSGFDEALGAGCPMKSGEETDFTIRALLAGFFVYETPHIRVVHHGFRCWEEGRVLISRYWFGTGATFSKLIRLRPLPVARHSLILAFRWAFGLSGVAKTMGSASQRWVRLVWFLKGFAKGFHYSVDHETGHFRDFQRPVCKSF